MAAMESGREAKRFRAETTTEQEVKFGCVMEGRCPEQHAATEEEAEEGSEEEEGEIPQQVQGQEWNHE